MCALVSAVKKHPVKLRVLSEASGTSRWLEVTQHQCLIEPTLGPMDAARLLVSANTRVYQLQVLYPVPPVVERYKGNKYCNSPYMNLYTLRYTFNNV